MAAWRDVGHIRWAWERRWHGRWLAEMDDGMGDGLPGGDENVVEMADGMSERDIGRPRPGRFFRPSRPVTWDV
jgi:hypothetical protein